MYDVGSTATTSAPALTATIVPAPAPAPTSITVSPGRGARRATTASLVSDDHISRANRRYLNMPFRP